MIFANSFVPRCVWAIYNYQEHMAAKGKVRISIVHWSIGNIRLIEIIFTVIEKWTKVNLLLNLFQWVVKEHRNWTSIASLFIIERSVHFFARIIFSSVARKPFRAFKVRFFNFLLNATVEWDSRAVFHIAMITSVWNVGPRHFETKLVH